MECRICGVEAAHPRFAPREMMYGTRETFRYFQCAACDCLQIEEIPEDMTRHYAGAYYSYSPVQQREIIKRLGKRWRDGYAVFGSGVVGKALHGRSPAPLLDLLRPLNLNRNSAVLDVGCGAGYLLHSLREIGMANVLGADPFIEKEISYQNGLRIVKTDVHGVEGRWDLIMFHHSFEHLPDPQQTLRSVLARLKPGGHCLLRVPVVSGYAWNHYGMNWVQLDAPRHFFLYSQKSIELLCGATGFRLLNSVCDSGALQFWGSEQYSKDIALNDPRSYAVSPADSIFSATDITHFSKRAEELNAAGTGDQAVFYLRKPS